MKKILILLLFIIPIRVSAISASSAIVMDINNNRVLYTKNIDDQRLIASITKIMTCLIALENGILSDTYKVGSEIDSVYGSMTYIKKGESFTLSIKSDKDNGILELNQDLDFEGFRLCDQNKQTYYSLFHIL